ncbi:exosome complex protein Rrp42 [Candidatus Woesearchaeota archaeon]|nr:exosome complex protein Rrp42 [Candidatus Woesearchaeota archaeon]MBW3017761.1 exosome complex protein Rrp42 [Candidatus Woesearchaeota archaeon]
MIKNSMSEHIKELAKKGFRIDGRKFDQYRDVKIETDIIKTAEGSARVRMGETDVIVGIKLETGTPFPDKPEDGTIMVGAELRPLANPDFESGPPGVDSIELARIVDRGIRESCAIDFKKLCITPGEKVWLVLIDITPINAAGNLFDAAGLAAIAALKTTRFPKLEGDAINYKELTDTPLPLQFSPIPVTVSKINGIFFVDLTDEEESAIDARLTISTTEDGTLCALLKGEDVPLSPEEISQMVDIALIKSKELRALL